MIPHLASIGWPNVALAAVGISAALPGVAKLLRREFEIYLRARRYHHRAEAGREQRRIAARTADTRGLW